MKHIALAGLFAASVAQGIVGQEQKPLEVTAAVKMELASVLAVEEQQKDYKKALQLYEAAVKDQKLSDGARQYAAYRLASLLKRLGKTEQAKAVLRAAGKGMVVALDDVTNEGQDPEREKQLRLQARELLKKAMTPFNGAGTIQGSAWYEQLTWVGAPAVPEVVAILQATKNSRGINQHIARELYRFLWQQGGPQAAKHLIEVATLSDGNNALEMANTSKAINIDAPEVRAYLDNEETSRAVRFLGVIEPLLSVEQMLALADRGRPPSKAVVLRKLARRDLNAAQLKRALALCVEGQKGANPEMGKAAELFLTSTEAQQSMEGVLMLMALLPDLHKRRVPIASYQKAPRTQSARNFRPRQFSAEDVAAMLPPLRAAVREIGTVGNRNSTSQWMTSMLWAFVQSGSEEAVRLGIEMWDLGYRVEHAFQGHGTADTAVELLKRFDKMPKQNRDRFFWAFAADDMTPAAFPVLCELVQKPGIGKSSTKSVIRLIGQTGHEDAADWLAGEWRKGAVEGNTKRDNELYVNALVDIGRTDKSERVRIAMRNMIRGFGGPRLDVKHRAKLMLALMSMRDERVLDFIAVGMYGGEASHPYPEKDYNYKQKPLHYLGSQRPRPAHGYSAEQITDTFKRLLAYEKRSPISTRTVYPGSVRDDVMVILADGEKERDTRSVNGYWQIALVNRLDDRLSKGKDVGALEACFLGALGREGEADRWLLAGNVNVTKRYRAQIRRVLDDDDNAWASHAIARLHEIDEQLDVAEMLKNRNASVREFALGQIANAFAKVSADKVLPLLNDTSWSIRHGAAIYLGAVVEKEAVPGLIGLLRDSDANVRKSAAEALTRIRFYHEQQAHWDRVLKGLDASPASAAEKLLVQAKPEAKKEQRLLAIKSLGVLGAPEALPFLIEWSQEKDKEIGAAARAAITEIHLKPRK